MAPQMPPEGTISPSGKGIVRGGQWVPLSSTQAPGPAGKAAVGAGPLVPPQLGGFLTRKETNPYTGKSAVELTPSIAGTAEPPASDPMFANVPTISPGAAKALGGGLSALGKGLEIVDIPFKLLHWGTDKLIRQPLSKIPVTSKSPVMSEGVGQAMAGVHTGDFPDKWSKKDVSYPPISEIAPIAAEFAVFGPYTKALWKSIKGLGRMTGLIKTAPGMPKIPPGLEGVLDRPEILSEPPSAAVTRRLLGKAAAEEGVPLAADDMGKVAGIEAAVEEALFGSRSIRQHAPGMGNISPTPPSPFTGTNIPRERLGTETAQLKRQATDPNRINRMINPPPPTPTTPPLVPPAARGIRYAPGMGNLDIPPERFHGAVPQERWGTETAKLKRAMQNLEHINYLIGNIR